MLMIISASRRTDIPAFYGEWLYRRLEEGWAVAVLGASITFIFCSRSPGWAASLSPMFPPILITAELDRDYYSYMASLFGEMIPAPRKSPTRAGCWCYDSIDIGMYDTAFTTASTVMPISITRELSRGLVLTGLGVRENKGSNRIPSRYCQPKLIP